ncbi:aminoacyl tRNA synthase complex-interacting multifunctional protein 1 [Exaiptasia diaphana]|uniref:tRNA-binding domain-containing protein n=1 Tax=Exaiptasia diaphana TaxID=2652724 RepID=A0A913XPS2_EXADI|nr:aminoacyl tRNA synthase complex-interacting multifunctional protein 1 [Exaiptasia diaphana]
MVGSNQVLERVEKRALEAEEMVELLKQHIDCLQKAVDKEESSSSQGQVDSLRRENERLKEEAAKLKKELVYWEVRNGVKQVSLPKSIASSAAGSTAAAAAAAAPVSLQAAQTEAKPEEKPKQQKKKAEKKQKTESASKQQAKKEEAKLDASRFNFLVGKILSVKKHPEADSLFVEEIDVGEQNPRTICSGLVGHIPMEKLQDAMVVVMANLKPVKMRGIFSQGMVMCAKSTEHWSVVMPPNGAVPGDKVVFDAYPGTPDEQLNPKKKVWEQCAPDFTTNAEGIPTFKGDPFMVPGKGVCTAGGIENGVVR